MRSPINGLSILSHTFWENPWSLCFKSISVGLLKWPNQCDVLEEPCLHQNDSGSTLLVVSSSESRHYETIAFEPQSNWLILVDGLGFQAILPNNPHLARIHCQVSCGHRAHGRPAWIEMFNLVHQSQSRVTRHSRQFSTVQCELTVGSSKFLKNPRDGVTVVPAHPFCWRGVWYESFQKISSILCPFFLDKNLEFFVTKQSAQEITSWNTPNASLVLLLHSIWYCRSVSHLLHLFLFTDHTPPCS